MEHEGVVEVSGTVEPPVNKGYSSGIPGLDEAVSEALRNWVSTMTDDVSPEDIFKKVCNTLSKGGKKFFTDDRIKEQPTVAVAQELIEDFVTAALGSLSGACWDQPWMNQADFSNAILAIAMYNFKTAKVLSRTTRPQLKKYIEDAQFRVREEERIVKEMWAAIHLSGIHESSSKLAFKHLTYSYDETFMGAPYGHTTASTSELALVQDFLKYWLIDFVAKSWEMIEAAVGKELQDQFQCVSTMFIYLCDPEHSVLPPELMNQLDSPPPVGWGYVADLTMEVMKEMNENPAKRARRGPWAKW